MKSGCESHTHAGGRNRRAVEGNCVVVRRGGEQPETEDRSRTCLPRRVNSIRHVNRASLLGKGEACCVSGKPVAAQALPRLQRGRFGCGWSGNDRKEAWDKWRDLSGCRERGPAGVRASIRARKPGNAGGAKGRRKTKGSESAYRINHSADCRLARTRRAQYSLRNPTDCLGEQPGDGSMAISGHAMLGPILSLALVLAERSLLFGGHSSIGEPYARDPHVRFGGRGRFYPASYLYQRKDAWRRQ